MPKYVSIAAHLSVEELALRSCKATHAVERSHYQLIWLLARGKRVREVAEITGYCANWIRILVRRYNQEGPAAEARSASVQHGCFPASLWREPAAVTAGACADSR